MAVDTVSKRVSALRKTLPIPDGTVDTEDRPHVTWNYSGITIQPIVSRIGIFGVITFEPRIQFAHISVIIPRLIIQAVKVGTHA